MSIENAAPAASEAAPEAASPNPNANLGDNAAALKEALTKLNGKEKSEKPESEAKEPEAQAAPEAPPAQDKKEEERFSRRFQELSRREKELVKQKQEIAEREKRFSEIERKLKDAEDDPLSFLEAHNLSYDKLTEIILSGGGKKDPAIKKLEEELKLEKQARQQKEEEERQRQEKAAVESFKADQRKALEAAQEKFQLVNALGEFDLVYQVTKEHFDQTKEILKAEDAAKIVEDYLEEQVRKLKGVSKLNSLLELLKEEAKQEKEESTPKLDVVGKKKTQTLSNDLAQDATEPSSGVLSDEDAKARMLRLMKWNA